MLAKHTNGACPPPPARLAYQRYLLAADDARRQHGLLGPDDFLPLLELGGERLHRLLPLLLLGEQLLALPAGRRHPLLHRAHAVGEELLTVEEPLHRELRQPQELDQSRVHGALAPLAPLAVQAAEGHAADVLLQGVQVQLAHHQVHVHGADPPPVHALPPRAELEGGEGGGAAGRSHAARRIQEGRDPRRRAGPLGVTDVRVVRSVVKWLQRRRKKRGFKFSYVDPLRNTSRERHSPVYLARAPDAPGASPYHLPTDLASAGRKRPETRRSSPVPPPRRQRDATTPGLGVRRVTALPWRRETSVPEGGDREMNVITTLAANR